MLLTRIALPALAVVAGAAFAFSGVVAQPAARPPIQNAGTLATDAAGPVPLPGNIPFKVLQDIKWPECNPCRSQQIALWGDPNQPGPYGVLIKWYPGNFSAPHQHNGGRFAYVLSGTWWVSSSTIHDVRTTYPMRAGTYVSNEPNTTHWDGNRAGEKEPAVILMTGNGPVTTTQIAPDGTPLPPAAGRGAAGGRGN